MPYDLVPTVDENYKFPPEIQDGIQGAVELSSENLNNITSPGNYMQSQNMEASTDLNYPVKSAGLLRVDSDPRGYHVFQSYTTYAKSGNASFLRSKFSGTWGEWVKTNWDVEVRQEVTLRYENLNDVWKPGIYRQSSSSLATAEANYPTTRAGILRVYEWANSVDKLNASSIQIFYPYNQQEYYIRHFYRNAWVTTWAKYQPSSAVITEALSKASEHVKTSQVYVDQKISEMLSAVTEANKENRDYVDTTFAATAPGGASDEAVDASISRAIMSGRIASTMIDASKAPSFQEAFNLADAQGKVVYFPAGIHVVKSTLILPKSTHIVMHPETVLDFRGLNPDHNYCLYSAGTMDAAVPVPIALTKDKQTFKLVNHGLKVGDRIKISSDDIFDTFSTNIKKGEIAQVLAVTGDEVTFVSPLSDTYITNVKYAKVSVENTVKVEGGTILGDANWGSSLAGLYLKNTKKSRVWDVTFKDISRVHAQAVDSLDVQVSSCTFEDAIHTTQAYGISFGDSTSDSFAENNTFKNVRHSLSTNNSTAGGGIVRRIRFENNTVNWSSTALGGSMGGGDAIDTHTAAEDISIVRNTINGSSGQGINVECRSARIENNTVKNSRSYGISVHNESDLSGRAVVSNNRVYNSGSTGMTIRSGIRGTAARYDSIRVQNNEVINPQGNGINVGRQDAVEKWALIHGNYVEGTPSSNQPYEVRNIQKLVEGNNSHPIVNSET